MLRPDPEGKGGEEKEEEKNLERKNIGG